MFARLTFTKIASENSDKSERVYNEEVAPFIRSQKGNISCWSLEPTDILNE